MSQDHEEIGLITGCSDLLILTVSFFFVSVEAQDSYGGIYLLN